MKTYRINIEIPVTETQAEELDEFFGPGELEMSDEVFELSMKLLSEAHTLAMLARAT